MSKVYQFRLSEDVEKILNEIETHTNAKNKAEVLREALAYYKWIVDEAMKNREIISIRQEDEKNFTGTGYKIILPQIANA